MELRQFLRAATKRERAEVAVVCGDSVSYLYQLAGGHRFASALLATRIEDRTRRVAAGTEGRLETVPREIGFVYERPPGPAAGTEGRLETVPRESLVRYPEIFMRPDAEEGA